MAVLRENTTLEFEQVYPPEISLGEMCNCQEQEHQKIEDHRNIINENTKYHNVLQGALLQSQQDLNFVEVLNGMGEEQGFTTLKGFCPDDTCENLEQQAKEEKWGLLIEEPSGDDQVPTLLRNPKWVNLIKPVFNLIEVLPGYKEFDVSIIFLLFFTVFFGILIGDAAYGAIFFVAAIFAQIKFGKKMEDKTPFFLVYILTGVTIIWGRNKY